MVFPLLCFIAFLPIVLSKPITSLSPIPCLKNTALTTFEDLIACFDRFTVSFDFYNQSTYDLAQPSTDELAAWLAAIDALLHVDANCTTITLTLPSILSDLYTVSLYTEFAPDGSQKAFCILSEAQFDVNSGFYVKGWGLVAVPAERPQPSRMLHFGVPHPIFDMNTPEQAAALFKMTGAKSFLVTGRIRNAFQVNTTCIHPDPGDGPWFKTDPAHDKNEPFFAAAKTIRNWQNEQGGCPSESCAFIQMHGKAASSCATDTVFMSTGLGNSPSSVAWYTQTVTAPIRRLQVQLRQTFPAWTFSLPSESSCGLVATTNVFGRLLNGIEEEQVCVEAADATTVSGEFIHLEQSLAARGAEKYDLWGEAIGRTFVAA